MDRAVRVAAPRLLLAALLLLVTAGFAWPAPPPPAAALPEGQGDAALYRAIDRRVARGENYYRAAVAEQRRLNFPVRPFVTVRLPMRSWLFGLVGASAAFWLLRLLAVAVVVAMARRLRGLGLPVPWWMAAVLLVAYSTIAPAAPVTALWADSWAGLLVALALACRTERRWGFAVPCGLLAVLFRELALPVPVAMAFAAWAEGRRGEAAAWAAAVAAAGLALLAHAGAVAAVLRPGDLASQGWVRIGGWGFDLAMAHETTPLALLPMAATAVAAPLALFGWVVTDDGYARRVALCLLLWLLAFLVVGRPENSYWGLLMAPVWLAGLPLAIVALPGLVRRCRRRPASAP